MSEASELEQDLDELADFLESPTFNAELIRRASEALGELREAIEGVKAPGCRCPRCQSLDWALAGLSRPKEESNG